MENEIAKRESGAVAEKQNFSGFLTESLTNIEDALPKDFNKARFVQNCVALLNEHPELGKNYSRVQLMAGLLKGATLGLDFYNKECYLIPYGNQLNYQTDYKGAVKLAKKYSIRPIKDIYAKLVREGDLFEEVIVDGRESVNFTPKPFNKAPVIGAFAVCLFEDGGMICDTMTIDELETTRKQSRAQNSPAWKNFTGEMQRKSVLHRLCKHIQLDFENPRQTAAFSAGMEIETDAARLTDSEISDPFADKAVQDES